MFSSVLIFELRYTLRQPTFWVISATYFLFGLLYISSSVVGSALSTGALHVNAPWAVTRMVVFLSYPGMLGIAAFSGSSIIYDFNSGTASALFCTKLSKPGYVIGRFLGGFLAALLCFSFVFVGLIAGHLTPWADPRLLGPFPAKGLAAAYFMFAAPNMFIGSCVLFSIALLTRDTMKTYVGAVAILIGFIISRAFAGAFYTTHDGRVIASLAEPFGSYAAMMAVLQWTPFERNTIPVVAQEFIGHNRVLWIAVGGASLLLAYLRFPFQTLGRSGVKKQRFEAATSRMSRFGFDQRISETRRLTGLQQFVRLTAFELKRILRSMPLLIIVGLSCAGLLFWSAMYGRAYGTGFYPYTGLMAEHLRSVFELPLVALIVFCAANLTWTARRCRADEIIDACPASDAVLFVSKLTTLFGVVLIALLCGVATAVAYQLYRGRVAIEPGVYAVQVCLLLMPYFMVMAAFALALQALISTRFIAMLAMVTLFMFTLVAPEMGVTSNVLIPGGRHLVHYNALAGFGHYLEPVVWFHVYWLLVAGLLSVLGLAAWPRGKETARTARLKRIRTGLAYRPVVVSAIALLVALLGVVSVIGDNVWNRNPVASEQQRERRAAAYERRYGELRELPQPDIASVQGDLRLFPKTRHFEFSGVYTLINEDGQPIDRVVLTAPPDTSFSRVVTARPAEIGRDRDHGVAQLYLASPLEPGERMTFEFQLASPPIRGFRNRAKRTPVAYDASLVFHNDFLPELGYSRSRELSDELEREEHGLPKRPSGVRAAGDPRGLVEREGQAYADWISFDLTIFTAADQTVIAQGELVEHRVEDERARFRFVTQVPVKLHAGIVSGRYEQVEEVYDGREGSVRVSLHHMPGHGRNTSALMAALQRSLRTLEDAFGPYPYHRLKLVEVAMDRPTFRIRSDTILADSSLGFINDPRLDDPRSPPSVLLKLPASMVANQYVQSIVMAANQPGATSISDGLGFYLSSLVWSDEAGSFAIAETIRDTAWHYFTRRAEDNEGEAAIVDHVNQTHVGGHKNAVILYGLELYLGRERMIRAIQRFLDAHRFKGPPFARMSDLVEQFGASAPDEVQPMITDFFERRTIFDIAAMGATVEEQARGGYRVEVAARAKKMYVSSTGKPRETEFDYPLPLVAFGERVGLGGARRVLGRKMVTPQDIADGRVSITVSEKPRMVGLDPFYRLLDRNYLDNRLLIGNRILMD